MDANKRQLKIKTGVVKRLHKEFNMYQKEETSQREKINTMKAANADAYDVKKQEEVLAETLQMIPDTKTRLENAFIDLSQLMDHLDAEENNPLVESQEWKDAEAVRKEAEPLFA
eukprot:TRINITY_DN13828_c0_g1_i1.p1 TRINITY_DN13828_c0_g1~~TRINITY_DN13828_c0_g1_i1.p1  ORF type:complete len:114 (+),score=26.67 TRINITY_DN13828_c0_g1_i1:2-343(+)